MNKKATGKTLLQLTGIVFIVTGLISLISACSAIYMWNLMSTGQMSEEMQAVMDQVGPAITATTMLVSGVLSGINAVLEVACGIIGVKFCNLPEKGRLCFIMGIVLIGMALVGATYNATQGALSIVSLLISLVLPLLYTWGGLRNQQEWTAAAK